jgi:hypothetical protein
MLTYAMFCSKGFVNPRNVAGFASTPAGDPSTTADAAGHPGLMPGVCFVVETEVISRNFTFWQAIFASALDSGHSDIAMLRLRFVPAPASQA